MRVLSRFLAAATDASHFPLPSVPEVAFLGRSNVGKSSVINSLVGAKLARTGLKPLYRNDHPAGEQRSCAGCDQQAQCKQQARTVEEIIKPGEDLPQRLVIDYRPFQFWDWRGRCQHREYVDVSADRDGASLSVY